MPSMSRSFLRSPGRTLLSNFFAAENEAQWWRVAPKKRTATWPGLGERQCSRPLKCAVAGRECSGLDKLLAARDANDGPTAPDERRSIGRGRRSPKSTRQGTRILVM